MKQYLKIDIHGVINKYPEIREWVYEQNRPLWAVVASLLCYDMVGYVVNHPDSGIHLKEAVLHKQLAYVWGKLYCELTAKFIRLGKCEEFHDIMFYPSYLAALQKFKDDFVPDLTQSWDIIGFGTFSDYTKEIMNNSELIFSPRIPNEHYTLEGFENLSNADVIRNYFGYFTKPQKKKLLSGVIKDKWPEFTPNMIYDNYINTLKSSKFSYEFDKEENIKTIKKIIQNYINGSYRILIKVLEILKNTLENEFNRDKSATVNSHRDNFTSSVIRVNNIESLKTLVDQYDQTSMFMFNNVYGLIEEALDKNNRIKSEFKAKDPTSVGKTISDARKKFLSRRKAVEEGLKNSIASKDAQRGRLEAAKAIKDRKDQLKRALEELNSYKTKLTVYKQDTGKYIEKYSNKKMELDANYTKYNSEKLTDAYNSILNFIFKKYKEPTFNLIGLRELGYVNSLCHYKTPQVDLEKKIIKNIHGTKTTVLLCGHKPEIVKIPEPEKVKGVDKIPLLEPLPIIPRMHKRYYLIDKEEVIHTENKEYIYFVMEFDIKKAQFTKSYFTVQPKQEQNPPDKDGIKYQFLPYMAKDEYIDKIGNLYDITDNKLIAASLDQFYTNISAILQSGHSFNFLEAVVEWANKDKKEPKTQTKIGIPYFNYSKDAINIINKDVYIASMTRNKDSTLRVMDGYLTKRRKINNYDPNLHNKYATKEGNNKNPLKYDSDLDKL